MSKIPVQATALFFDDIRAEVGNKLSLMGQLAGVVQLANTDPPQPLDRLAIIIHAKWPRSFRPRRIMLRVAISDRMVLEQETPLPDTPAETTPENEFSGQAVQAAIMLRGQPINPGDEVKVWLRVNTVDIPAGRLKVERQPDPSTTASRTP